MEKEKKHDELSKNSEEMMKKLDSEAKKSSDKKNDKKKINEKKLVFVIVSAVVLILLGILIFRFSPDQQTSMGMEDAKIKAESFINDALMMPGTKATVTEIEEEYGLYKIMVDIGGVDSIESYISKDGKLFFPQSIDIQGYEDEFNMGEVTEINDKRDRLDIELFVMSHCPYSNQMHKGLIPVLALLENYVDFELKFNDYVMNDVVEIEEQLTQYCIQKEEEEKLLGYLLCFSSSGDSEKCLTEEGVDKVKISACAESTDNEYDITAMYEDSSTWLNGFYPVFPIFEADNDKYNIQGSPTLIINGEVTSSSRDSQSLLNLACGGFLNPPSECDAVLSSEMPGYGFDE